jgi:formylglycine-generating enzyme required for sulfatase activity
MLSLTVRTVTGQVGAQTPLNLSIELNAGQPLLTVVGAAGSTYEIQWTDDLSNTGRWFHLCHCVLTGQPTPLTEPTALSPGLYYRAVWSPNTNLVFIPPGTFTMGSPLTEALRAPDETQHDVTTTHGFWMSKNLITQGDYLTVTGSNPSYFNRDRSGPPDYDVDYNTDLTRPVEGVSWFDAVSYCQLRTQQERIARLIPTNYVYRLPTESEWEYAARAGTTSAFFLGSELSSGQANFNGIFEYDADLGQVVNSKGIYLNRTTPVGSFSPNAWGLYDMIGNVSVWCQDWYDLYPTGLLVDPQGPDFPVLSAVRVVRGGSWSDDALGCRAAARLGIDPGATSDSFGFRVVLARDDSSATTNPPANITYYASPFGLSDNTGLSLDSPWPLQYALDQIAPGDTLKLLDGLYDASQQTNDSPYGAFQLINTGTTAANPIVIEAVNKWKAIIAWGTNGGIAAQTSLGYRTICVLDGLQVCSNQIDGITICNSSVVRNCWVHDNSQQGINASHNNCYSNVFEYNLVERNGTDLSNLYHYHGLYVSGPWNVVRNNVLRENRDGTDIQIYTEDTGNIIYGNMVYGNLIYGGTNEGYCADIFGATYNGVVGGASPGTNYAFGNTIIGGLYTHYGTLCFTNNILTPAPGYSAFMGTQSGSRILGDYNAGVTTLLGSPHELVTSWAGLGFVNPNAGLYWLASNSSLRGQANATIVSPVDFFGQPQFSVTDIGAFQYSTNAVADERVLDPSPIDGADYWAPFPPPFVPAPLLRGPSKTFRAGVRGQ